MNRLYIFGIGGTGVRVIKSLTFLLAAGIRLKTDFEIIPIIVDPHSENENLKETVRILTYYENIRKAIGEDQDFFHTKIRTLKSLSENDTIPDTYSFKLGGSQHQKFRDFLQLDSLSENNQALIKSLFSERHLDTDMELGFIGNPHMGSIVLNKFRDSLEFKSFANNFSIGDRVFIVSSIFGGTGAAGFPIILKNIRRADESSELANKEILKNSSIGGLLVQPYFSVDADNESSIQKSDWMIKTKSAFDYYKKAITNQDNESINSLYYLADNIQGKSYKNDPGQFGQKNPAHLIEMLGAMSIIDFANTHTDLLQTENGKPINPFAKEFGVLEDKRVLRFSDFAEGSRRLIGKPLTKFFLACKYLKEELHNSKDQAFMKNVPVLSISFFNSALFDTYISRFYDEFHNWLMEIEQNERGFKPFNLNSALSESINGITAEKHLFKKSLNYIQFNNYMNEIENKQNNKYGDNSAVKLLDLLSKSSEYAISKYFKSLI